MEKEEYIKDTKDNQLYIEKKKKRKKIFKITKIVILIILVVVAIIYLLLSPIFNIEKITVNGIEKLTEEEIISASGIEIGQNTYKINTTKIKEKIKENAYVENVKITRGLPNEIKINVQERKVRYMVEYGGSYVYLSRKGYILENSIEKKEVPILQGLQTTEEKFIPGNRLDTEDLEKLTVVLKIIEIVQVNEMQEKLLRIDISNKNDYKIIFEEEGKIAHLGDNSNLETKILYVKALIEDNKNIRGEIFVNMDLNQHNPYFRKEV